MNEIQRNDIVVAGATGGTGGATAAALAERGVPFRAISRRADASVPGGVLVQGDLGDPDFVRTALSGARAVYLVTPSSARAEAQQKGVIDAAVASGVEHLVLLSQFAADTDSPVRFLRYHAAVEAHLAASGIAATVLRPNLFMQGLLAMQEQLRAGVLPAPIGDARVSAIDVRDIGDVAATALVGAPLGTLTLTGPEPLTHAQMASQLASVTGRAVRFVDVPPHDFAAALRGRLPEWQVEGLLEDYAHYASGEAAEVTSDVRRVLGRGPRPFARFARDYAELFR